MTDWYSQPYPGGIVPVPGFPRELQVGCADGPDVIAYKRTVWRAGRWQGPASRFDDTYSHGFAMGKGPNVIDTGVAGVQRQQRMPDTGIIDETLFDVLRSIVIPDGLPNAGQLAMDATAANLIGEAWQQFGTPQPAPGPKTRDQALAAAQGWVGTKESPAGSNHTPFGQWYGVDYQPWCAIFQTYVWTVDAGGSPSFVRGQRYAYVPYIVQDARADRNGLSVVSEPVAGDLVCYDWQRDGTFDHVGIFEAGTPSSFTAIEGNTSTSSNSNGGEVMRRNRKSSDASIVFVRVAEP
jgi:hypothetical protein